jgi:large subunit ribosomal protein L35
MHKQKTHKGLAKRVKVTARGKVKRRQAFTGHLLSGRSSKKRRQLRRPSTMTATEAKRTINALGGGKA